MATRSRPEVEYEAGYSEACMHISSLAIKLGLREVVYLAHKTHDQMRQYAQATPHEVGYRHAVDYFLADPHWALFMAPVRIPAPREKAKVRK